MMNIYRLVSPEKLEIYALEKSGVLRLRESLDPSIVNFKKIKNLMLSAHYSNWDVMRVENTAYKPDERAFLFSSRTAFDLDDIVMSAPFHDEHTGFWAQAWCPKVLLGVKLSNISEHANIYAEGITVLALESDVFWRSGPTVLSNLEQTGFTERHSVVETQGKILESLDGLKFTPRVPLIRSKKRKFHFLIALTILMLSSLLFAWEMSVKEIVTYHLNPPPVFDNSLYGIDILGITQGFVSDGAIDHISFDQRKQQSVLTFTSAARAQLFFEAVLSRPDMLDNWNIILEEFDVTFKRKVGQ